MITDARTFKHWTAEEDQELLARSGELSVKELAIRIGRTPGSVSQRLLKLRKEQVAASNGHHPETMPGPEAMPEPDELVKELGAMRQVIEAISPLPVAAQERVLRWAMLRITEGD